MDFYINEVEVKSEPLSIKDELIHDKPNINVTTGEIRIKWIRGVVSLVLIEIMSQNEAADPGAIKKTLAPNTFEGGDCLKGNPKNCVFSENQLTTVKCTGIMVKIGSKASNKSLACMYKCVDSNFETMDECSKFVPETLKCVKKGTSYVIT